MSKRHLEPDSDSFIMNHKSTSAARSRETLDNCEDDRLENCSGVKWRRSRLNCNSSPGNGSLKRPRPVTLKPFDFSLIKDEPSAIDSQISCSETSHDADVTVCSGLSSSASCTSAPNSSQLITIAAPPTMILPFLFLGSQNDALSKEFITNNGITHILNASTTCPKSPYIANENFLRIPVNDSHTERLLPYFDDVKKFLDGCCKVNGRALVHCLAGISRSPTLVIAYIMSHLRLSQDDAYRYVKVQRSSISPNFNFLGQLMEFESILRNSSRTAHSLTSKADGTFHHVSTKKLGPKTAANSRTAFGPKACLVAHAQSPTTAFAKLSFDKSSPSAEDKNESHVADQRSIIASEGFNRVIKRSKPANNEMNASNNARHDSRSCLTFAKVTNSESGTSNQGSVNFKLSEKEKKSPPKGQNVSDPIKPIFTEHSLRKLCTTEATECPQSTKRTSPPVRPSSIAISGLQFDFDLLRHDIPSEFKGMILSDVGICKSPMSSLGVLSCVTEACKKVNMDCTHDLLKQVESACRSRSFSDIPAVAASTLTSAGAVFSDVRSHVIETAKTSSGVCMDHVWQRALEGRESNGSLSSVSSGSLHGSREMVQVS